MVTVYLLDCSVFKDRGLFREMYCKMPKKRQEKISLYRFWNDKYLSLGAGVLLSYGLKERGLLRTETPVVHNENGKPYLKDGGIFFNMSHSGKYAVCAFSDEEIGVDIEELSDVPEELMRAVCTDAEYRYLLAAGEKQKEDFFRLWTVKESFMKYIGTGLATDPARLEVAFGRRMQMTQGVSAGSCFFKEYEVEGYSLTVCSRENAFADRLIKVPVPACEGAMKRELEGKPMD